MLPDAFHLPFRQWRRLFRRAYRAQQRDHSEVCGVFAMDGGGRVSVVFLKNHSDQPGHFELEPREIFDARKRLRAGGRQPVGLFHSHPISAAIPGPGDIKNSSINDVHLIVDVCGITARMWRVVRRGRRKIAVELPLTIERSDPARGLRKRSPHVGKRRASRGLPTITS